LLAAPAPAPTITSPLSAGMRHLTGSSSIFAARP
jgi:hypothetical protein